MGPQGAAGSRGLPRLSHIPEGIPMENSKSTQKSPLCILCCSSRLHQHSLCYSHQAFPAFLGGDGGMKKRRYQKKAIISCVSHYLLPMHFKLSPRCVHHLKQEFLRVICKKQQEKKNSARTYCPSQKDTQSIPKKTFICSKITILYYLDRKTRCCVANIAQLPRSNGFCEASFPWACFPQH